MQVPAAALDIVVNLDQPSASALKTIRAKKNWTQADAAEALGLSLATYRRYEAPGASMPVPTWRLLLLLAGYHPDYVLLERAKLAAESLETN